MNIVASETCATINELSRHGGISPAQWVLGRTPRYSAGEQGDTETAGMIGAIQEREVPTTIFAKRMGLRHEAKKAFMYWDSSQRVSNALLRKSAPKAGDYNVGDLISFQRNEKSQGVQRNRWSPAARIIGFEGPKICWALCEGVPFCLATDRLRPANDAELLAYQMIHHQEPISRWGTAVIHRLH